MSYFRKLSHRLAALRERETVLELCRTYGVVRPPRGRGMVPDPWDDYPRGDSHFYNWKRSRRTQYRPVPPPRPATPHAPACYVGFASIPPLTFRCQDPNARDRYRVRQAYRRHRRPSVWTPAPSALPPGPPPRGAAIPWEEFLAIRPDLAAWLDAKRLRLGRK